MTVLAACSSAWPDAVTYSAFAIAAAIAYSAYRLSGGGRRGGRS